MSKIKKIVVVLFCLILAIIPCFSVSAETGSVFTMACSQPPVTENSAYVELLLKDKYGSYNVMTISLNASHDSIYDCSFMVECTANQIDITAFIPSANVAGILNYGFIYSNGSNYGFSSVLFLDDSESTASASFSFYYTSNSYYTSIEGIRVYGANFVGGFPNSITPFTVLYSGSSTTYNQMLEVMQSLGVIASGNTQILNKLQEIYNSISNTIIQNQNENTDKITQNEDKNTQQIIDNQNQLQENEKNEAGTTGGGGVDDIGNVIPNDSQGFINSLGNLVGAMSYNGTSCNWEMPSVSLPAIAGVMPQIKLWDKLEIPFEYWIQQIPSGIMLLIQSILTIALIVYCFKELYSIISYVLTLRGGGANE